MIEEIEGYTLSKREEGGELYSLSEGERERKKVYSLYKTPLVCKGKNITV